MNSIYQFLHQQGVCCLSCGAWSVEKSLFCRACEKLLWDRHPALHQFQIRSIKATSLFCWQADQDRPVSRLLEALKRGRQKQAFYFYAEETIRRMSHPALPANTVLVPCPSHRKENHAQVWAEAFSRLLNLPLLEALQVPNGQGSQKMKAFQERHRIHFQKTEMADGISVKNHVIFIDDIVTTGSTALAAHQALVPVGSFEVWCLAQRSSIAGSKPL